MYYPLNDARIALQTRTNAADAALMYASALAAQHAAIRNRASMRARLDAAERANSAHAAMVDACAKLACEVPAADYAGSGSLAY